MTHRLFRFALLIGALVWAVPVVAQPQGMDLRQASGVPLPAADLPAGSVSVRVVRGSFANNLAGVDVTFTIDGAPRTLKTDASGRVQVDGLKPGSRVKASAAVEAERLESQEVTMAATGIRFVLVASGPAPAASAAAPAAPSGPTTSGTIAIGPDSRIVADYSDERLNLYYVLQIVNAATTPVDIGGPLIVELPQGARGANLLEGATKQATVSGAHVTVLGPFAPGVTSVNVGFEVPFSGDRATVEQRWPVATQGMTVFGLKSGPFDLSSEQFTAKREVMEQGQPLVVGLAPALGQGEPLVFEVSGLPHAPVWPRNLALGASAVLIVLGLAAGVFPRRSRAA